MGEVGTAGTLATLDDVAGDADSIGTRRPGDGDGGLTGRSGGEIGGGCGRSGVAASAGADSDRVASGIDIVVYIKDVEIWSITHWK